MTTTGALKTGSRFVLEPCGFSPASAGLENATAGSAASRSTKGALQRSLALTPTASPTLSVFPCESPEALREKRQRSLALTPPPLATVGDLSQRACELRKVPFESSPALARMEFTVSSLPFGSPEALRAGWRFSPASAGLENATAGAISHQRLCSSRLPPVCCPFCHVDRR